MEISTIASLATSVADMGTKRDVGIEVLKKTMELASSNVAQLIEAIPDVAPANLPPNLGNYVNTKA